MALVRWVTEMGMGVDVHGHDYTKAARRAVSDALRHSSLNFFGAADKTRDDMHVEVIVAVADPGAVDTDAVKAEVPYGVHPRRISCRTRRRREIHPGQRQPLLLNSRTDSCVWGQAPFATL